ncbi:conserved hypothetical protein [Perkinsus marinus ATCC 50983]|uniref:FHA domain-containing protein n=2 Tax=Perkinsus marinus (strain ATCC 50983 / TXsc) TaxID=423536 RepID=C5KCS9_PERM5|nr:conserved hypothetical protein [Perkinsus marinus ATCC 50983]EER17678.1 conserved hypothetical protein [Perkinsus marinus ATCC 50983]|eukprot:XP_002785882.1 conserved hypothetical protein [Perkinsus marinus ATCC 50983]
MSVRRHPLCSLPTTSVTSSSSSTASIASSSSISGGGKQGNIKDLLPPEVSQNPESNAVVLNVYDLDQGIVRLNTILAMVGVGGAFHVGVSVFGKEYYYSGIGPPNGPDDLDPSGVYWHEPTHHDVHVYRQSVYLGSTALTERRVYELVRRLGEFWTIGRYDLLRRNCCQFAEALAQGLGVGPIPKEFCVLSRRLSLAADSLGGALGAVTGAVEWISQPTSDSQAVPDSQFMNESNTSLSSPIEKPILIVRVLPLVSVAPNGGAAPIRIEQGDSLFGRTNPKQLPNFHVLDHPSISRTHARLNLCGETVTIVDLGSVNGTRVVCPWQGQQARPHLLPPRSPRRINLLMDEFIVMGAVSLHLHLSYQKH